MIRRRTAILIAAGLLAPLAMATAPAGAVDQDLVVSTTAGPPGTVVEVSSASCTPSGDLETFLEVSFITGAVPDEQLAGIGEGFDGTASFTIPDWVDPDQPAVIEARCQTYDLATDEEEIFEYDPVAFDVEPGGGTPVQVRTFSRTELLAGQALTITGSCGPVGDQAITIALIAEGADQSGRNLTGVPAGQGLVQPEADGSFELPLFVSNAFIGWSASGDSEGNGEVEVFEEPMTLEPGAYTVFTYCIDPVEETFVFLEPEVLDVTGVAPTGGVDLVNEPNTRDVTFAGSCDLGEVQGTFQSASLDAIFAEEFDPTDVVRTPRSSALRPKVNVGDRSIRRTGDDAAVRAAGRELPDDGNVGFDALPDADGTWSVDDATTFDVGLVLGFATCGDPFAEGYAYDPQGVAIEVVEEPPVVPTTVPPTTPVAPPANSVPGTPRYAG